MKKARSVFGSMFWSKPIILLFVFSAFPVFAQYAPVVLDPAYEHDKWGTLPRDLMFYFAAYTVSFDGDDDNNGNGSPDVWGIPEWVSYEIKALSKKDRLTERPRWMTDGELHAAGIAPGDESYAVSGTNQLPEVKTDYRFVRGHMCPKETAERISRDAAYNTHTLLNAVPQLQWQNNGIWKTIENLCSSWADTYGRVWVTCGPVFFGKSPALWLGQEGEIPVAVPDALFKIVVRENADGSLTTIAFIIPNILPKEFKNPEAYISTMGRVESLTGLSFLTTVHDRDSYLHRTGSLSEWQGTE